jgi:hypothetical protein
LQGLQPLLRQLSHPAEELDILHNSGKSIFIQKTKFWSD